MNHPAEFVQHDIAHRTVVYEQPLNERMRTFLRLEFLYQQILFHFEHQSPWNTRAAVSSLLDILALLGRGDVRGDVLKELERRAAKLEALRARPEVDTSRLQSLLGNLGELRTRLNSVGVQVLQKLRDNEFLNAVKHRSAIPGGTCEFDLPDYGHWLSRSYDTRMQDLERWLLSIRPICDGVAELLWLTRESAEPLEKTAHSGMFQLTLDRTGGCQMLRIALPRDTRVYPEISGGQHRCSVRFLVWKDAENRPVQTAEDVDFLLTCC